jgi:hypothetical protein
MTLGAAHLMETILFSVADTDAGAFGAASAQLLLVAVIAAYIRAPGASTIDTLVASRYE